MPVNSSASFATEQIGALIAGGTFEAGSARSNLEFPDAFGVILGTGRPKDTTAKLLADAEK